MALDRPIPAYAKLTKPFEDALVFLGECFLITVDVLKRILRGPVEGRETLDQMAFIGVMSVPIVSLTTFFSGAVLSLYLTEFMGKYHATAFIGATVGLSVAREIGPVLAGIMVSARCGSAMAAQIGTMAVTEQVDALRMLRVNPTNYLVIPRIVAAMAMLPVLTLVGDYSGIFGGWLVAVQKGVPSAVFMNSVVRFLHTSDMTGGLLKGPVFGFIIALVACQQGLRTRDGAVGVGRATTNAVVISMVLVYIANYFLAQILFR